MRTAHPKSKAPKEVDNTGFGENANKKDIRLFSKTGSPNIKKIGQPFYKNYSLFHTILNAKWVPFLAVTFLVFVIINIFFTVLYLLIGTASLSGLSYENEFEKIMKVFFFSVQTFTTVGYGNIHPTNFATGALSSTQAFCGLLFFALVTGLLYAKFSKPRANIKFSYNVLISPYNDGNALMFRLVPIKNNTLTDARVYINLSLVDEVLLKRKFYTLKVEIDKITSLSLNWTVVHPINEDSPLYGLTEADLKNKQFEVLVHIRAFDEAYSNSVIARTSYNFSDLKIGYKFVSMYVNSDAEEVTLLDISKLDEMHPVALP